MKVYPDSIAALAELSLKMWQYCHRRGFKANVNVSHSGPASRYLTIKGIGRFRLSDHARPGENTHEVIIREGDDYNRKCRDAMLLLEQTLDAGIVFAA